MGDILEFPKLLQEVRGSLNPGRLKLQSSSLTFENTKTGKLDTFPASDVDKTQWIYRARAYCFKVIFKSGITQRYDGFRESDYEILSEYLQKNYQTKLEKKDPSLKGSNWGVAKFNGNTLDFKVKGNTAFEIPLTNISHSATTKNEVTIEFHQNNDAPEALSLVDMAFHIPSDATGNINPVKEFYKNVTVTGDAPITSFSKTECLLPRGHYDIKIFPNILQLHGKTFDYKIPYATMRRIFLLPLPNCRQVIFVASLDTSFKQGQTSRDPSVEQGQTSLAPRHHFLIIMFNKETTMELSLSENDHVKLLDFVSQTRLKVKNIDKTDSKGGPSYADVMKDSGDDDSVHNAYMEKMKAEGKHRGDMDMEEDDDESEGGEKKERKKKSNVSDDSDAAGSGDDDPGEEDEEDGEKKEKKKEKKEKKKSESEPRKSKKKDVDPDKPKRAQSAYFLWMGENQNKIKEEFPGISVIELSKKLGERWKDVKDKSKYEAMAAKEKESYELAMSDYKKSHKDVPKSSPSPKKMKDGRGSGYKSKEFVESDGASESDSDGKPLKRTKKGSSSEPEELPEDEPILSTPEASGDESD